jgi:hypothetical protein
MVTPWSERSEPKGLRRSSIPFSIRVPNNLVSGSTGKMGRGLWSATSDY